MYVNMYSYVYTNIKTEILKIYKTGHPGDVENEM